MISKCSLNKAKCFNQYSHVSKGFKGFNTVYTSCPMAGSPGFPYCRMVCCCLLSKQVHYTNQYSWRCLIKPLLCVKIIFFVELQQLENILFKTVLQLIAFIKLLNCFVQQCPKNWWKMLSCVEMLQKSLVYVWTALLVCL